MFQSKAGGSYEHNLTTLESLEKGDLVQFHRGAYSHWGVYIGGEKLIHLAGDEDDGINGEMRPEYVFTISGVSFNKAKVCEEKFWAVVGQSKAYKNNSKDKKWRPFHPDEIVRNALSKLGEVKYNLMYSNCEHFAKWCRYGLERSDQVENVVTGAAVGTAMAVLLGSVYAITKYWSSSTAEEEEEEEKKKERRQET